MARLEPLLTLLAIAWGNCLTIPAMTSLTAELACAVVVLGSKGLSTVPAGASRMLGSFNDIPCRAVRQRVLPVILVVAMRDCGFRAHVGAKPDIETPMQEFFGDQDAAP